MNDLYVKALRQDIVLITKIFESMGHLAIISTLDRQEGVLRIRFSRDFEEEIHRVLDTLPCAICEYKGSLDS